MASTTLPLSKWKVTEKKHSWERTTQLLSLTGSNRKGKFREIFLKKKIPRNFAKGILKTDQISVSVLPDFLPDSTTQSAGPLLRADKYETDIFSKQSPNSIIIIAIPNTIIILLEADTITVIN
jgi:hypothetical protein